VILTAYLDESGTHDGSPVTVMGGMLANARQWEAFEKRFSKLKAVHGFEIFHTKKFKKKDGDFRGWTTDQCFALMNDLAPMTATAFTEGVTVALDNAAYEAEYRLGDKPKSGKPVPVSTVHATLRNRLYTGEFEWNGRSYLGKHQPLVTRELWERVQGVLDGRHAKKNRRVKHDFAFSGLIACGHCGCSIVGEIKKQRYVYYHCTGYKGRCDEPYVREEIIEQQFTRLLARLKFDDEVLDWVREALDASHADERREHDEAIRRLRVEYDRLQNRIHAMYLDKLDGKVDETFFARMAAEWRAEQDRCLREIERHQTADQSYLEEGLRILELARNAQRLFETQEPREKRRLLNFVVSNCSWKAGELTVSLRQPFDLLTETAAIEAQAAREGRPNLTKSEIWLPGPDSNQRPTG
jgi:site-specific DNA recombinase